MQTTDNDETIRQLTPVAAHECTSAEMVCGANPGDSLRIRIQWKSKQGSKPVVMTQPILIELHNDLFSSEFFERHRSELDVVFSGFIRDKLAKFKPQEGKKAENWNSAQTWVFPEDC